MANIELLKENQKYYYFDWEAAVAEEGELQARTSYKKIAQQLKDAGEFVDKTYPDGKPMALR